MDKKPPGLSPEDRKLADAIARANPLERVKRTGHVKMLGSDARLASNDEDLSEEDRLAIDRAYNDVKNDDPFRQRDADRQIGMRP